MEKNALAWGTVAGKTPEAARYWLRFALNVWYGATHGAHDEPEVQTALDAALEAIERLESPGVVLVAIRSYRAALEACDPGNPVDVSVGLVSDHGSTKLKLCWSGAWTAGRYLAVSWEPDNYPIVFVEWDTGTGKESSFLSLPSTAIRFAAEAGEAPPLPLYNHFRAALAALGQDVSEISETGYQAMNFSLARLRDLANDAIRRAVEHAPEGVRIPRL